MAKFYYNGVLLPEIPNTALATNPYAFIRNNTSTGYYDLVLAIRPFYYDTSEVRLLDDGGQTDLWYRIQISSANSATSWGNAQSHSYKGWTVDASRYVLWANHNVYIGGASSSNGLYFSGTNPVSEDAIVSGSGIYLINGETLADIANAIRITTGTSGPIPVSSMASLIRNQRLSSLTTTTSSTYNYSLRGESSVNG